MSLIDPLWQTNEGARLSTHIHTCFPYISIMTVSFLLASSHLGHVDVPRPCAIRGMAEACTVQGGAPVRNSSVGLSPVCIYIYIVYNLAQYNIE